MCLVAAVVNSKTGPKNGKLYTEEDWNTESSVSDEPYRYSKVWSAVSWRFPCQGKFFAWLCARPTASLDVAVCNMVAAWAHVV